MLSIYDACESSIRSGVALSHVEHMQQMAMQSLQRHGHGYLIQQQTMDHDRHFEVGGPSGAHVHTSPPQEDYNISMSAPDDQSQEDMSSVLHTPRPDPFLNVQQYRRRRRRRVNTEPLDRIDESGS